MISTKQVGDLGENHAVDFLLKNNYQVLEKNWFFQHKEIDIIAIKENTLCFIEVKTRKNQMLLPREAVTLKKQQHLIFAAAAFIEERDYDLEARFDIIEVMIKGEKYSINHIEGAFTP